MNTETLAAQSLFSRLMIEGIDLSKLLAVPCGFQSLFGPPMGNGGRTRYVTDSRAIDVDVRKGNRGFSTPLHRGIVGKAMNKPKHVSGKFTSFARTFPLLHDTGLVTADQLLERVFDEEPWQPLTQFARAQRNARDVVADIVLDHIYWMEYAAVQMVKTGKMDLIYGTSSSDERIDTKRDSNHTYTAPASWATAGTSILDHLDSMATLIIEDANKVPDVLIVGGSVPGYLAANTEIQTYANLKAAGTAGFSIVWFGDNYVVEPRFAHMIANGFNPLCKVITKKGRKINIFTYEGNYVVSGSSTYYMGADEVVMMSSKAACDRYFGPPEKLTPTQQMQADWNSLFGFDPENIQLPPNIDATPEVIDRRCFSCDVRRNEQNTAFEVSVQAAPMYVTRDTDAFVYCADVTP